MQTKESQRKLYLKVHGKKTKVHESHVKINEVPMCTASRSAESRPAGAREAKGGLARTAYLFRVRIFSMCMRVIKKMESGGEMGGGRRRSQDDRGPCGIYGSPHTRYHATW